ncbi:LuxR C-terminal-related transcriptional regulator [Halomonas sp. NO4]|uniref:LuxR C-terminal-related transcriptional regulator n=1 Tax=Halomonas sp. NO4 TaxID=2484813 RepID=UPI0013D14A64|nr:LuxR C-terminal-related transcriptional regulator [Halomonas sp. NO4]
MAHGNALVLLVTDSNPQSQVFIDYIHDQLECPVTIIPPDEKLSDCQYQRCVLLLDVDHLTMDAMRTWQAKIADDGRIAMAAFNVRDESHAADILAMMHLEGIFYRSNDLPMICKGIAKMLEGDLWMSRSLMTQMIDFYRKQQRNAYRPVCGLTHRELEIIGLLGSGASNADIANQLFISEHTIKSHLYNIFRKINVHNRIQAMNWARHNLMGIAPPTTRQEKTTEKH